MHFKSILELYGCSDERLREIFTSTGPGSSSSKTGASGASSPEEALTTGGTRNVPYQGDGGVSASTGETINETATKKQPWDIRRRFEYRIRSRVISGIGTAINNAKPLQAVDMAWDAQPIQKETIPLMLWAQGKIKQEDLISWCQDSANCDPATAAKFLTKDKAGKQQINVPRICDVAINLPKSFVTRRHAALSALWDNLWPLLRYDPRGTSQRDMLNGDVVTQLVDIMGDEYNYRHFLSQTDRDKLLYSSSLIFPRSAYDRKTSWRFKKSNLPGDKAPRTKADTESFVTQEGIDPVNPHPSRWIYDLGAPLANINTNNGPSFVGYWDIVPFETVRTGPYYNTDRIVASEGWTQLIGQYGWYFAQYFQPCVLSWPPLSSQMDPALMNDRPANIGIYSGTYDDKGVLLTQYFEKINPKVEGIGDYDAEIWLRMTAAGDGTVVAAEFMPSIPACYGGINCNDNRVANSSLASEMLWAQDQVSNILTTLNEQIRRSFTQVWVFNKDLLDEKIVKNLEDNVANKNWWLDPQVLVMSFSEKQELLSQGKFDPSLIMFKVEGQLNNAVQQALAGISQLLALADRVVNSSPNEQGQPMPREVSAKETQTVETTIQSIYSFYNQGPREQRAAFKRLVFESMRGCGTDRFEVPVLGRYSVKTIEAAGFKIKDKPEGAEDATILPSRTIIIGSLSNVDFDVQYTTRDGMERPSNAAGAQVLQMWVQMLLQIPGMAEAIGPRRLYEMTNIIGRMVGAPDEFLLKLDEGEDGALEEKPEIPPAVKSAIDQIMQGMQKMAEKDAQLDGALQTIAGVLGVKLPPAGAPAAAPGAAPAAPPQGAGAPPPAAPPPGAPAGPRPSGSLLATAA